MGTSKKLGIWIDHSMAYLMEFTSTPFEIKIVESDSEELACNATTFEELMVTKKRLLFTYYNKIAREMKNYNQFILFGPNNAKLELFDVLSEDDYFFNTTVEIKKTDSMTFAEQHKFIKAYFTHS